MQLHTSNNAKSVGPPQLIILNSHFELDLSISKVIEPNGKPPGLNASSGWEKAGKAGLTTRPGDFHNKPLV